MKRDCGHNRSLHVSNKKRCGSCKNVKMHSSTLCAAVEIEDETSCCSRSKLGFRCVKANRSLSMYQSCSCEGDVMLKLNISMVLALSRRATSFPNNYQSTSFTSFQVYQNSSEAELLARRTYSVGRARCSRW